MSRLHRDYLGIDGTTDVLSFALETDGRGRATSGEVVVCVPWARRVSKRIGGPVRVELLLYAIHGMLHLCGYDDRTERESRSMHRLEDKLLSEMGFGAVFSAGRATGAV